MRAAYTGGFEPIPNERIELSAYYTYEKYSFADAYTSGTTMMPFGVSIFMKADSGPYKAHVLYTKLTYRF
ncbi:MAG: hypothetical protein NTV05_13405 [Acidobacteria bacterium]|nr:hypothetical protein [Acidobacteriota bacterium]